MLPILSYSQTALISGQALSSSRSCRCHRSRNRHSRRLRDPNHTRTTHAPRAPDLILHNLDPSRTLHIASRTRHGNIHTTSRSITGRDTIRQFPRRDLLHGQIIPHAIGAALDDEHSSTRSGEIRAVGRGTSRKVTLGRE